TVESALASLVGTVASDSEARTLSELLDEIKQFKRENRRLMNVEGIESRYAFKASESSERIGKQWRRNYRLQPTGEIEILTTGIRQALPSIERTSIANYSALITYHSEALGERNKE